MMTMVLIMVITLTVIVVRRALVVMKAGVTKLLRGYDSRQLLIGISCGEDRPLVCIGGCPPLTERTRVRFPARECCPSRVGFFGPNGDESAFSFREFQIFLPAYRLLVSHHWSHARFFFFLVCVGEREVFCGSYSI